MHGGMWLNQGEWDEFFLSSVLSFLHFEISDKTSLVNKVGMASNLTVYHYYPPPKKNAS